MYSTGQTSTFSDSANPPSTAHKPTPRWKPSSADPQRNSTEAYGKFDGIVINPAAYTHTSVAILDALKAVALPAVEVHLSDVDAREPFRHLSYAGMACQKTFKGLGFEGYRAALRYLTSAN